MGITLEDVIITMQRHHQEVIMRIDELEKRMDDLEVKEIPRIKKAVDMR